MLKYENLPSKLSFLYNKRFLLVLWTMIGILSGLREVLSRTINNFLIFASSYFHLTQHKNLYAAYPAEYSDFFLYGPVFSVFIAPFALLPVSAGVILWNVANSLLLFYAVYQLPLPDKKKAIASWLVLNSSFTSLVNLQFNGLCTAFIILSYTSLNHKRYGDFLSAFFTILGAFIKFYGLVGLIFFFFAGSKKKYLLSCVMCSLFMFGLPMLIAGPGFVWQSYSDWLQILLSENNDNSNPLSTGADMCVMGMFRRVFQDSTLSNLYFLIPGMLLLGTIFLQWRRFEDKKLQLQILASVLIFIILASTGAESPTLLIGMTGVAIWYISAEINLIDNILLISALLLSSFISTDIIPAFVRKEYVYRYGLTVLPLLLIWLRLHIQVLKSYFLHNP
jgi:hypothetical protein